MLTCRELIDFLDRYLEGGLSDAERKRFDEHLSVCPPCVDYLKSYRATIDAVHRCAATEGDTPDKLPAGLVDAILAARADEKKNRD